MFDDSHEKDLATVARSEIIDEGDNYFSQGRFTVG